MPYPPGTLGTLMELYEDAVNDFVAELRRLASRGLDAEADFGGVRVGVRKILIHIIESADQYAAYAEGAIRKHSGRQQILEPSDDPIWRIAAIIPRTAAALEGGWDLTDAEIENLMIDAAWGVRYSLDQLLEHAIVHILWHRRQCRRVIDRSERLKQSHSK